MGFFSKCGKKYHVDMRFSHVNMGFFSQHGILKKSHVNMEHLFLMRDLALHPEVPAAPRCKPPVLQRHQWRRVSRRQSKARSTQRRKCRQDHADAKESVPRPARYLNFDPETQSPFKIKTPGCQQAQETMEVANEAGVQIETINFTDDQAPTRPSLAQSPPTCPPRAPMHDGQGQLLRHDKSRQQHQRNLRDGLSFSNFEFSP